MMKSPFIIVFLVIVLGIAAAAFSVINQNGFFLGRSIQPSSNMVALQATRKMVVVSSPFFSIPNQTLVDMGKIYAFDGMGNPVWTQTGQFSYQYLGWSLDMGGDPNNDRASDVIAGSPWNAGTRGRVDIFSGRDGSSICGIAAPLGTISNTFFGASVSAASRLNGSNTDAYLAGAPLQDTSTTGINAGKAYGISIGSGGVCSILFSVPGQAIDDHFGKTVLARQNFDLNGDGINDYVVSSVEFGNLRRGNAYAMSGATNTIIWNIIGGLNESYFGQSLERIPDVDGDGVSDLVIGGPGGAIVGTQGPSTGWVSVVSGATGIKRERVSGENSADLFGFSVAFLGDNNHNGKPEFAVGAPGYSNDSGKVYVYEYDSLAGSRLLWSMNGERIGDSFGYSISGVFDLDENGVNELVIGAPYFDGGVGGANIDSGKIYVVNALTGNTLWTKEGPPNPSGPTPGYKFGYVVSGTPID